MTGQLKSLPLVIPVQGSRFDAQSLAARTQALVFPDLDGPKKTSKVCQYLEDMK